MVNLTERLTERHWRELEALQEANEASGCPSFQDRAANWHGLYDELVRVGFVEWGPAPEGFTNDLIAGTRITPAGQKALAEKEVA